ncbi:O-antigen ligase family protein [Microbacterium koreense]|uniref:O-antigen ligase family protein n=1 Tax=Microbacterium koreense TaxID=323761 RepID=A0ABW2ZTT9_9MICO
MAVYSKHPASAPPTAPVREKTGHLLLRGWCIFVLVTAFSGTAWVNAFGELVAAIIAIASAGLSIALWLAIRPVVQWRRLPWFAMSYILWAVLSLTWSAWPLTTAITLLLLLITTTQAFFVAAVLTWREIIRSIGAALKWVLALSIAFELWVSLFVQAPILPGFVVEKADDPIMYWSRDNLFDGGRIQGIMGNANLLGPIALLAIVVFAIRYAARAPRRAVLLVWMALAAFLFVRAASATAIVAAAGVVLVLITVLLMRRTTKPGQRTRYYIGYAVVGLGGGLALWLSRDAIFSALGRGADLTGREDIWKAVLARADERPVVGWGFATPWAPWDPAFDGWIIDHGQTVMQAHSLWVDVYLQLGIIGLVLMSMLLLAYVWRTWFFAVDRPRWDLRADRPYSPLTLLPTLVGAILLVQSIAESTPLLLWGWMLLMLFGFKIKQSPHIGVGPAEERLAIEQGELTKRDA